MKELGTKNQLNRRDQLLKAINGKADHMHQRTLSLVHFANISKRRGKYKKPVR